jgi:hypothetical protein
VARKSTWIGPIANGPLGCPCQGAGQVGAVARRKESWRGSARVFDRALESYQLTRHDIPSRSRLAAPKPFFSGCFSEARGGQNAARPGHFGQKAPFQPRNPLFLGCIFKPTKSNRHVVRRISADIY